MLSKHSAEKDHIFFSFKYLLLSPQTQLEVSQGVVKNIRHCCHKHSGKTSCQNRTVFVATTTFGKHLLKISSVCWDTVSNCGHRLPSLHACNSTSKLAAVCTFTTKHWATNYLLSCLPANPQLSGYTGGPCNCPYSRFKSMQPFSVVKQAHVRLLLLRLKVPLQFDFSYSVLQFCSCSMKQL